MRVLLVAYDNGSYISWFPQGLSYIAAVLLKDGHEVEIYSQDLHHYPEEHLTQYLDNNRFDFIGVSVIGGYYQYRKLLSISEAINKSKNRPFYVIGGHGPAPAPNYFLGTTDADMIVIGEGEETVIEIMDALENKKGFDDIKGIAFRRDGKVVVTERRPLIQDLDSIPFPAYDLFPMEYYRLLRAPGTKSTDFVMPLLSGRGCTFRCNFCYRMDSGFRARESEGVIEEVKLLQKDYGVTYINFSDELLMSSKKRVETLCNAFIKAGLKFQWTCNGRLNYATPPILKLMKDAGCVFINYGIECFDNQILKNMNKALTTEQIVKGIESTLEVGISPGYNIIFGNVGENKETLEKGVQFLLKYDDGAQMRTIRPVTPYPGSPLYYYAIEKGLLEDCEDFYERKHLNSDLLAVNFTDLTDAEFHEALFEANTRLLNNYFKNKYLSYVEQARKLYIENDTKFRGFRQI